MQSSAVAHTSILLTAVLVTVTAGVAVDGDVTAVINDGSVTVSFEQRLAATQFTVTPDNVTVNGVTLGVVTSNPVNVTVNEFNADADPGGITADFTANTSGGAVEFVVSGLAANTRYTVQRDGSTWTTPTTDSDGTLSFLNSDWSERQFTIIRGSPGTGDLSELDGRINTTQDGVVIPLGETRFAPILLYNPLDQSDTFDVSVDTVMDGEGRITVAVDGDDRAGEHVVVDVGPGEVRVVPVQYTAGFCTGNECSGMATFVARSLQTDVRDSVEMDTVIDRSPDVYRAPGLGGVHIVITALGAALIAAVSRSRS